MTRIGTQDFRPTAAFLRQVALSVAATLIASAVLSGLRSEWASVRSGITATPALTSGGKFAARAETASSATPSIDLPGMEMPKPVLASLPSSAPARPPLDPVLAAADFKPAQEGTAKPKRPQRVEAPRRRPADVAAVVPPRRADYVGDDQRAIPPAAASASTGVWSTTRELAGQAVSWTGSLLDRLTPVSLLP